MINEHFGFTSYNHPQEITLVQDLVEECIQIYGMDIKYIPKTLVDLDTLFGESPLKTFDQYYTIEMYFNNPMQMGGGVELNKFLGFANALTSNFLVSQRRFNQVLNPTGTQEVRPKEGDVIYVPYTRDFWDVKFVDFLNPIFQFGKVMMWKLEVEKLVYSSERISTGNTELDNLESVFSHDVLIPNSDAIADNTVIQTEANAKIDHTEVDPFTEGQY